MTTINLCTVTVHSYWIFIFCDKNLQVPTWAVQFFFLMVVIRFYITMPWLNYFRTESFYLWTPSSISPTPLSGNQQLLPCVYLNITHRSEMIQYVSFPDFIHLAYCPYDASIGSPMERFYSFLGLNKIPSIHHAFFIHESISKHWVCFHALGYWK